MIFLANVWEIEIPDIVMMIEADEKFAISNRDVSWHICILRNIITASVYCSVSVRRQQESVQSHACCVYTNSYY